MKLHTAAALAAAFLFSSLAPLGPAQAQTAAPAKPAPKATPKPAAKPAARAADEAGGKTLSLGGAAAADGAASGVRRGIMTRDELRVCLADEASITSRSAEMSGKHAPLEAEKAQLMSEQQVLREERVTMEAGNKEATEALNLKTKSFSERAEKSKARVQAFNEAGKTGAAADRERIAINAELTALEAERKALESEQNEFRASLQARVTNYNDKLKLVEDRVADWNRRNNQARDDAAALEAERKDWVSLCSNRRYREEDEIAIKAGK